ncbi:MAG: hypothetical protein HOY76_43245 [Streptomyces sp.]|nr:hypothetical protein [Streptomyces sp.]
MTSDHSDGRRGDGDHGPGTPIALDVGLAPVGTPDGEPITARRYDHPLVGDRPIVRLMGEAAAPGEDRLLAAAGFGAPDVGPPVAAGRRRELGYPAWALIHDPGGRDVALAVAPEMERAERLVKAKPGPALEMYQRISERLPHDHHPAYWEQVGRAMIAAGRHKQAAIMFGRARTADRHATAVDPARRRAVFLEFALAGALSVKDIKAYVAELARDANPVDSYGELRELAVRRTLGGLPPWPDMLPQLAKPAKAAGLDVVAEFRLLLETLVDAPALWRAADGFWTAPAQRVHLTSAIAGSATLRRRLLRQLTDLPRSDLDAWWLALLEETGAFGELTADAADWLTAMLARYRGEGPRGCPKVPEELLRLLPGLAERIRDADGPPVRLAGPDPVRSGSGSSDRHWIDAAVPGRCLAAGIPIADPEPHQMLAHWQDAARVGLETLTADARFAAALARSIQYETRYDGFGELWTSEPLRPLLRDIVDAWLRDARSGGLQGALDALTALDRGIGLGRRAVAAMPDLRAGIKDIDLVAPLTRSLRAGILDELGWQALDEAAAELKGQTYCRASWPVLTAHDRSRAIAVGPGGRIAEHRYRAPRGANQFDYDVHVFFSGGHFLVCHWVNGKSTIHWSDAPDDQFEVTYQMWRSLDHEPPRRGYTFLAPDGRRFMGHRPLAPGDRRVGPNGHMFHDGRTFWWHTETGSEPRVRRIDPAADELGEPGLPDFLDPSLLDEGEHWVIESSSLAPLPEGVTTSPLGTDGTLVGLRVARDRTTGRFRYRRIDGAEGADGADGAIDLPPRSKGPWGLLDIPGAARRLLLDGDDEVTARDPESGAPHWRVELKNRRSTAPGPSPMAAGTSRMPPPAFWHFLTPRDPAGSRALREIPEDTVRRLLAAAATSQRALTAAVQSLLPEVGHPLLLRGVVGFVQEAAWGIRTRDKILSRLKKVGTGA